MKKSRFTAIATLLLIFLLLPLILSSCAPKQIYSLDQGKWIAVLRNYLNVVDSPYFVFYCTTPIETSFAEATWRGKLLTEDGWQEVRVDVDYDSIKVIDSQNNVILEGTILYPDSVAQDQRIMLQLTTDTLGIHTAKDYLRFWFF